MRTFIYLFIFSKGIITELTPLHAQSTWRSKERRVQVVRLAAFYNYIKKKKKKPLLRKYSGNNVKAFTFRNFILFYFTIPKSHFINYTIQFYNIPSILTFIFLFPILLTKIIFLPNKIIYPTITLIYNFTIQHKPTIAALHTLDTTTTQQPIIYYQHSKKKNTRPSTPPSPTINTTKKKKKNTATRGQTHWKKKSPSELQFKPLSNPPSTNPRRSTINRSMLIHHRSSIPRRSKPTINQSQSTTMPKSNHGPNPAPVQALNEKECGLRGRGTLQKKTPP